MGAQPGTVSGKESASTHSSRSTAPKTNALTPCINGDGPMGLCARTVATTDATQQPQAPTVQSLPPPDLDHRRHHLRLHQAAPDGVVSGHLPHDPGQERGLGDEAHRHLGISYNAAWRIRHKLMQVMMERDREHPLSGWIQLDDAYLGGERSGGKRGRGAPGKTVCRSWRRSWRAANDGSVRRACCLGGTRRGMDPAG